MVFNVGIMFMHAKQSRCSMSHTSDTATVYIDTVAHYMTDYVIISVHLDTS